MYTKSLYRLCVYFSLRYYSSFSTSLPSQTPQVVNIRGFDASSCAKTKEILHSKTHGFPHDFPDIPVDHQTRAYTMCRAAHSTVHSTVLRWTPPLSALPRNHQVPSIPAKDVAAWPHTRDKTLSVRYILYRYIKEFVHATCNESYKQEISIWYLP